MLATFHNLPSISPPTLAHELCALVDTTQTNFDQSESESECRRLLLPLGCCLAAPLCLPPLPLLPFAFPALLGAIAVFNTNTQVRQALSASSTFPALVASYPMVRRCS